MVKSIFAAFLILIMLCQINLSFIWKIYYVANKAKIASTLCIKKDIKSNKCQGKCYLNKKIKESKDNTDNSQGSSNLAFFDFLPSNFSFNFCKINPVLLKSIETKVVFLDVNISSPFLNTLFRPPIS